MKVVHICDGSVAGRYFRNIAEGFAARGVELTLVELRTGVEPDWLRSIDGVDYVSLRSDGKLQLPRAVRDLAALLNERKADILHTHLFYSGIVGVIAGRRAKHTTTVMMRHHTGVVRMLGSPIHVRADRWMAENADHVVTVSNAARRYMTDFDGIRRDDIEVVYLGFDFDRLAADAELRRQSRSEFRFADDDIVIGYVANFASGKGHVHLLNAFSELKRTVPNAKLILSGSGRLQEVDDAIGRLALGRRIILTGWRDDVRDVYNAMDVFVQPSLSEAFSQVLIEAMGCGLPVIATRVGGADEVIESGVNGVLIEPDSPEAIHTALIEMIGDRQTMAEIAERGRESVRSRFPVETMIERHLELYERWR